LIAKDAWGQRGLAYPIRKNREGNFVIYYYELSPAKVKEIDRQLRILPNVLRHLVVKPPKHYEIVRYAERYEQWLKERSAAEETRQKEEERRLQKKVAERAKIQAKRVETKKKEITSTLEESDLTQKLEELISDDTLGL
jgi:ATPase subunit of ABC transporter with duplicated ATPase domains